MTFRVNVEDIVYNPDLPWVYTQLINNKTLRVEDIEQFNLGEYYYHISEYINIRQIINNPKLPWSLDTLSYNKTLTIEAIRIIGLANRDGYKWNWFQLSEHMRIEDIRANPDLLWISSSLQQNKGFTIRDLELINLNKWDILVRNTIPMKLDRDPFHDVQFIIT